MGRHRQQELPREFQTREGCQRKTLGDLQTGSWGFSRVFTSTGLWWNRRGKKQPKGLEKTDRAGRGPALTNTENLLIHRPLWRVHRSFLPHYWEITSLSLLWTHLKTLKVRPFKFKFPGNSVVSQNKRYKCLWEHKNNQHSTGWKITRYAKNQENVTLMHNKINKLKKTNQK